MPKHHTFAYLLQLLLTANIPPAIAERLAREYATS